MTRWVSFEELLIIKEKIYTGQAFLNIIKRNNKAKGKVLYGSCCENL